MVELGFRLGTPPDADLVASRNDGQRKVNTEAAAGSLDAVAVLVVIDSLFHPRRLDHRPIWSHDHDRSYVRDDTTLIDHNVTKMRGIWWKVT